MDVVTIIATTMGVAWASGINLYAAVFMLGWMGGTGSIDLPPELEILSNPLVMGAAGLMYVIEFFADKIPGVDTGWDVLHTFIRIPAGAMLAAGSISPLGPEAELAGLILGGSLAAGSHFTKAGTRVLINTSPEPFTNWGASVGEDVAVIVGLWTALNHPVLFIVLLVLFIALVIWLLPKIWRGIKAVFRRIRGWFGGRPAQTPPDTRRDAGDSADGGGS
jgi:hypothetical protein